MEKGEFVPALPVRAAIAGHVVRFRGVLGQAVKAEEPLFEIHDLSGASVRAYIPEQQLAAVHAGQHGRARFLAYPELAADVVISRSDQTVGSDGRVLSVWADLNVPAGLPLLDGMLARLAADTGEAVRVLAVPREAVLWEGTQPYLFVRSGEGVFERRVVQVGRGDDRLVEVTAGLREGEAVAVAGVAALQTAYATVK
jgi:cobalt-zinc-cadmium efflux system membrane fusion protein